MTSSPSPTGVKTSRTGRTARVTEPARRADPVLLEPRDSREVTGREVLANQAKATFTPSLVTTARPARPIKFRAKRPQTR